MSSDESDDSLTLDLERVGRLPSDITAWGSLPRYHDFPSLVTSFATRTQMWNVLNDLDVGVSIQTALKRLKPLQKAIKETVKLALGVRGEVPAVALMSAVEPFEENVWMVAALERDQLVAVSPSEEDQNDALKRARIQTIQQHANLTAVQKGQLINKLMMGRYYDVEVDAATAAAPVPKPTTDLTGFEGDTVTLSAADKRPTYHNEAADVLGCDHYQRNCKVECSKCRFWYPCRFCHDLDPSNPCSELVRKETRHVLCQRCFTPQEPSETCVQCLEVFACYFCPECVLYDNDPTKDIYHCADCGICRLGLGLGRDFYHCKGCDACIAIALRDTHKCLEQATARDCPICSEFMFSSTRTVVFMPCGHAIHQQCYDEHTKHSYKCPICTRTVLNMEAQFRVLDQEIETMPMPAPYNTWTCEIQCIDCGGRSRCPYHLLGLKCGYCRSYNTAQKRLFKSEEDNRPLTQSIGPGVTMLTQNFPSPLALSANLQRYEQSPLRVGTAASTLFSDDDHSDDEIFAAPTFFQTHYAGFMSLTSEVTSNAKAKGPSVADLFKQWMNQAMEGTEDQSTII